MPGYAPAAFTVESRESGLHRRRPRRHMVAPTDGSTTGSVVGAGNGARCRPSVDASLHQRSSAFRRHPHHPLMLSGHQACGAQPVF